MLSKMPDVRRKDALGPWLLCYLKAFPPDLDDGMDFVKTNLAGIS